MTTATPTSTQGHVRDFLGFADSPERFTRVAQRLAEAAEKDEETRDDLAAIARWVAEPRTEAKLRTRETIEEAFPVLYLRAQESLRGARVPSARRLRAATRRAKERLHKLEPDFLDQLLGETRSRVSSDELLATRVDLARREVAQITPQLDALSASLIHGLPTATSGAVTAASARCSINGVDASCWLVVGIIVVAVLIKL